MSDESDTTASGIEQSEGLTQGSNDGSVPCDLCQTPIPVHTPRIPVRDDGVVAQLCGACEGGLEDYFGDKRSTEAERSEEVDRDD